NVAADVFALAVFNGEVSFEVPSDSGVNCGLIGHQDRFPVQVFVDDRPDIPRIRLVDLEAADLAAALDQAKSRHLVRVAALLLGALLLREESFVSLDDLPVAAQGRCKATSPHGFANAVPHEPCGLKSDAKGSVKLVRANTLLRSGDQIEGLEPNVHR